MKKEYKGFLIYLDKFYIEISEIDQTKKYEFKLPSLVEVKESNRKSYRMNEYSGNKTIYDAIDIYITYKDMELMKPAHSFVYDHWFKVLERDVNLFIKTFGVSHIEQRFFDLGSCLEYWKNFGLKDIEMNNFLTDEQIQSFWNIQQVNDLIKRSRQKNLDDLVF